jgi:DNA-binding MarR family transcriptional regulator
MNSSRHRFVWIAHSRCQQPTHRTGPQYRGDGTTPLAFYVCQKGTHLCLPASGLSHSIQSQITLKTIKIMHIFTGLKKIREFERRQLPFLRTVVDFDIVIEIGYAEEQGKSLTLKQLFLLNLSSRTTVRRKLTQLIEQEIVIRRKHANDNRSSLLTISPSIVKVLNKYGGTLTSISALHFK